MDKYDPGKKVALYADEWGSWYTQELGSHPGFLFQQNALRDAEVAALSLNIFHRHTDRVKLAAIAQMVNVLQAMILTDGPKMLLTPTYHVFDMYQPFMEAMPLAASASGPDYVKGIPMVDVSVARGKDGKLWLALVNTDPHKAAHVVTNLAGTGKGQILTGPVYGYAQHIRRAQYHSAACLQQDHGGWDGGFRLARKIRGRGGCELTGECQRRRERADFPLFRRS